MIRVFTAFSGYDSQCLALDRLKRDFPTFDYELVGWAEIDKYAIQAHNALYPQWADRNYGDISKIDWDDVPDFDLFTYSFPCFIAGTLLYTSNGYTSIENIKEGDEVLTHANRFCKVEKIGKKPSNDLHRVKGMMFDEIVCTGEHPFYSRKMYRYGHFCKRAFTEPKWVKAKDLCKSDYLGYAICTKSELPRWEGSIDKRWGHERRVNKLKPLFDKPSFWYIMGRYVGDGWMKTNEKYGSGIVICCSDRNEHSLVSALNEIGFHFTKAIERTVYKYHISMNELNSFVKRYGHLAHGKRIDHDTINLPVNLLKSFIDGVLDSDGCFTENEYKVSSVSRELIYGLQHCVAKVYNCHSRLYKTAKRGKTVIEGRVVNQRDQYSLVWHTDKRVQDKAFFEDGYIWFPLQSVEKIEGTDIVYNIQVSDDHSYTANGAIVHNCTDISNAGRQKGFQVGSGTRSSLLWECCRAIEAKRPRYLLMENVKSLVSKKFLPNYIQWLQYLTRHGYRNFSQVINAKDYGVPQCRTRVFCVSILDEDSNYQFPKEIPLNIRMKHILDGYVDEGEPVSNATATTLCLNSKVNGRQPSLQDRIYDAEGISTAITTCFHPKIKDYNGEVRSLTPRECFRLMGVEDKDIDTIQASGVSNSRQYKLAGNSIVVDCLYHIFRKMFVSTENEDKQLTLF